jgi:hypothetical protein
VQTLHVLTCLRSGVDVGGCITQTAHNSFNSHDDVSLFVWKEFRRSDPVENGIKRIVVGGDYVGEADLFGI